MHQRDLTKNLVPLLLTVNRQIADQVFHEISTELVLNSQLQNEVANLKRQVLNAKKVALQRQIQILTSAKLATPIEQLTVNQRDTKILNFGSFYKY